jgi:hypothetical protein
MFMLLVLAAQETAFNENDVYGNWTWLSSSGGLLDHTITPEDTKKSKRIELTKDHVIMYYAGDSLTVRLHYQIQPEKTIFSDLPVPVLRLTGSTKTQSITLIGIDTLLLKDNAFDGYRHLYRRLRP